MALSEKQKRFAEEYLVDCNAAQAAVRAGYSPRSTGQGSRLLANPEVQEALRRGRAAQRRRTALTADRVLEEYARIAFYDVRRLFDSQGRPVDITRLDDDSAAAVAGVEVTERTVAGKETTICTRKYKLPDKLRALELLGKHLGLFDKGGETPEESAGGVVLMPAVEEPEEPEE